MSTNVTQTGTQREFGKSQIGSVSIVPKSISGPGTAARNKCKDRAPAALENTRPANTPFEILLIWSKK